MGLVKWFKSKMNKTAVSSPEVPKAQASSWVLPENLFYGIELVSENITVLVLLNKAKSKEVLETIDCDETVDFSLSKGGLNVTVQLEKGSAQAQRSRNSIERRLLAEIPVPDLLKQ